MSGSIYTILSILLCGAGGNRDGQFRYRDAFIPHPFIVCPPSTARHVQAALCSSVSVARTTALVGQVRSASPAIVSYHAEQGGKSKTYDPIDRLIDSIGYHSFTTHYSSQKLMDGWSDGMPCRAVLTDPPKA